MSKCDLYLVFEKEDRTYHPGDEVVGAAKVVVNKDIKCDKIFLRTEWRTHGRGNRASGAREEVVIAEGTPLRAGEEKMMPFRFTVPDGPLSYHGEYLNVDWYARLQVDVPWAIDPKQEEEFLVIQNLEDTGRILVMGDPQQIEADAKLMGKMGSLGGNMMGGCLPLFGLAFLLPGLGIMASAFFVAEGLGPRIGLFAFGSIFAAVGGGIVFWGLKNTIARKKIGEVKVGIEPQTVKRGGEVTVSVRCDPSDPGVIENISSVLVCNEVVVSGSGTNRSTHSHQVFEDVQGSPPVAVTGVRGGFTKTFTHVVPADAPFSFWADDNHLRWQVVVRISIKGWPDWSETHFVTVQP